VTRHREPHAKSSPTGALAPWWGSYPLAAGEAGRWRIGPLTLWAKRLPGEWRFAWRHAATRSGEEQAGELGGEDRSPVEVRCPLPAAELPGGELPPTSGAARVAAVAGEEEVLRLLPALPDRQVVARPRTPFRVPAGGEAVLLVSLPVWLSVTAGDGLPLVEVPTVPLAETWVGPTTIQGAVGYAARGAMRLAGEPAPTLPHLATTRLTLRNGAAAALTVERLALPATQLALWWHAASGLWTQPVAAQRDDDGDLVELEVGDGPPRELAGAEEVAPARVRNPRQHLVRALEALLG
jgi:hypothetical protein